MKRNKTFQIANARAVTPGGIVENCTIKVENGVIADLGPDIAVSTEAVDVGGAWVLPGFVDLHSDSIEKEIETRPGSFLPVEMAVAELDKKMAAAGVTTIFHSISFAEKEYAILRTMHMADRIIKEIRNMSRYLCVDTRIHLRYEITDSEALPVIRELIAGGYVDLISIMDHTPGQGQFKSKEQFSEYYGAYFSRDRTEIEDIIEKRKSIRESVGMANARVVADICRVQGIPLASHDDDTIEKVDFVADCGAAVSEFPITSAALEHARLRGLMVAVGSPNIIRGGSHNNNLSALEIIKGGGADIVCSDYVPSTLLHALFKIHHHCMIPLSEASRLFSDNPSKAVGMMDRGRLAPGRRADLIVVDRNLSYPRIIKTYVTGMEVYSSCVPSASE